MPKRVGITFDSNIINEKDFDSDSPTQIFIIEIISFILTKKDGLIYFTLMKIKKGDYLTLKVKDGKLNYFLNGVSLGDSYLINRSNISKELYLLIHRRNYFSDCQIIYLYELYD